MDELSASSPFVISGSVADDTESIVYNDVTFHITKITINKLYRGMDSVSEGDTITLLQTDILEDPLVEERKELILFLKKYQGPVIDNAYRIVGLKQGHFTLNSDGKVYPISVNLAKSSHAKDRESSLVGVEAETASGIPLEELVEIIDSTSYNPPQNR
ncbi:hypothetical protein ACAF76_017025 [Brevibacillus sp. TJ4]|uniref:hypothetical protein n=1 Tax=Brevibacillus sp. TJ4 TaxID=3234853 RepID=UPI0037D78471